MVETETRRLAMLVASSLTVGCAGGAGTGHYARVNGLNMYYEIHGNGRPLVLLHGGGSTVDTTFGKVLPALARTHRIIAPEQQGHGHTGDIDRPLSFEQMADDTAALLRHLGVDQADVLGFSNGGNVAMQLAIRHPARVRKLIVASAFFECDGMYPQVWDMLKHATVEGMPPALRQAYLQASPHPDHLPAFVSKIMDMMLGFQDWRPEDLQSIRSPALVMTGDRDVLTPEHAVKMFRLLPHAQLAVFPGSGHGTYLGEVTEPKEGSRYPEFAVWTIETFLDAPMPEPHKMEAR